MATNAPAASFFKAALEQADATFFQNLNFDTLDQQQHLCVRFRETDTVSLLTLPTDEPEFVSYLIHHGVDGKEAWLAALRHEAAHIELNMKCFDQKLSPPNSNDQLVALKIPLTIFDKIAIPQQHKESAIEAFCDVTAVKYLKDSFPDTWVATATHIANYRKIKFYTKNSSTPIDYFSHPAIFRFIENPQSITPTIAAEQTYKESKAQSRITDNAKSAMTEHIDDAFAAIKENREAIETELKASRFGKLFPQAKNHKSKDFQ